MSQSEFEFIQNIKNKYLLSEVGDDCAVLPKDGKTDLLVTADMLVEDIDFRLDWTTPEFQGHKALAVSLSDIAAMGGKPVWSLLSMGVPETLWKTDFVDRFYEGWFALARNINVELVGGDVSRTPDKVVIDSIVGGEIEKGRAILRSTAKPGDAIFVTGTLGGAAAGLRLVENGARIGKGNSDDLLLKQLQPQPQVKYANLLQSLDLATSMIDLSDGLSSDLQHICNASVVGASLRSESLPINRDLSIHFAGQECLDMALNGGEDFELLFTVSKKNISHPNLAGFTHIGEVTANAGIIELSIDGEPQILQPKGYRHF
ncbi:MAG: thiamine-phosphate kinase [Pyrinomonadaceae bacterium]|nr:thiamine-phosphate kinase [Acidobacteriota bacterium]MBP7375579.1 thiamine-phosphate kinase [Pyrinomonadaceae bacterium]